MKRNLILVLPLVLAACSAPASAPISLPTFTLQPALAPPSPTAIPSPVPTLTPSPEPAPIPTAASRDMYVTAEYGLNLRDEPGTTATVLEIVLFGSHLSAIGLPRLPDAEGIAWQKVQTDWGQSGWVSSEYLSDTRPVAALDLFAPFTIEQLRLRSYDSGPIEIVRTLEDNAAFTRYAVAYPSDGLRVTAMMNVPKGSGSPGEKFPVIILNHGYVDPDQFPTGSYIRAEADYLARRGYLTVSPDYRGHAEGEGDAEAAGPAVRGENSFRVAYAIDVLNALHALPGIPQADATRIGMWGHSMGGGVTLKVLTVDLGQRVDAAVLYGAMSGDEAMNLRHIDRMWQRGIFETVTEVFGAPEDHTVDYARISPLSYVADIAAPISIHHGALDDQVPVAWSQDLAHRLEAFAKPVDYHEYADAGHSFRDETWLTFMQRVAEFFDRTVKAAGG